MTTGTHTKGTRRRRSSAGGRRSRSRVGSLGIAALALAFIVTGWLYLTTQIKANTIGTALTEWAEAGHAPDGAAWNQMWSTGRQSATGRFRAAGAAEHLALLSEWRAHQVRLDPKQRATWYATSAEHYAAAIASRPLSADYWTQYAYSGLGSLSRVDRLTAVDRALELGHGRNDIAQRALMSLLADVDLDVDRLSQRVTTLTTQGRSAEEAFALLEQASNNLGYSDPRLKSVREIIDRTSGAEFAAGDDG